MGSFPVNNIILGVSWTGRIPLENRAPPTRNRVPSGLDPLKMHWIPHGSPMDPTRIPLPLYILSSLGEHHFVNGCYLENIFVTAMDKIGLAGTFAALLASCEALLVILVFVHMWPLLRPLFSPFLSGVC